MLVFKCDSCPATKEVGAFDIQQFVSLGVNIRIRLELPSGWTRIEYSLVGIGETPCHEKLLCPDCARKNCDAENRI